MHFYSVVHLVVLDIKQFIASVYICEYGMQNFISWCVHLLQVYRSAWCVAPVECVHIEFCCSFGMYAWVAIAVCLVYWPDLFGSGLHACSPCTFDGGPLAHAFRALQAIDAPHFP